VSVVHVEVGKFADGLQGVSSLNKQRAEQGSLLPVWESGRILIPCRVPDGCLVWSGLPVLNRYRNRELPCHDVEIEQATCSTTPLLDTSGPDRISGTRSLRETNQPASQRRESPYDTVGH